MFAFFFAGEAEVDDADLAVDVDEDVLGFDVTVQHAAFTGMGEAGRQLDGEHENLAHFGNADAHEFAQIFTFDELDGDEIWLARTHLEHPRNRWVRQLHHDA